MLNDDLIAAGGGFGTHPHRDMEIVTWVLEGALEHRDSEGNEGVITPGVAQRMSAGSGIRHSEKNASDRRSRVRLLQMWVPPDTANIAPGYEQRGHQRTQAATTSCSPLGLGPRSRRRDHSSTSATRPFGSRPCSPAHAWSYPTRRSCT